MRKINGKKSYFVLKGKIEENCFVILSELKDIFETIEEKIQNVNHF